MLDQSRPFPRYAPPRIEGAPDDLPFLPFLRRMLSNPVTATPRGLFEKPFVIRRSGDRTTAFIGDPGMIEEVLVRRSAEFPKSGVDRRVFAPALGEGLLTARGEDWRWKRRLSAPAFSPAAIDRLAPRLVAPFERQAEAMLAGDDEPLDVAEAMTEATLAAICGALFDPSDRLEPKAISEAIDVFLSPTSWVVAYGALELPRWVPFPGMRRQARACRRMRAAAGAVIAERRRSGLRGEDLTSVFLEAEDPAAGRPLSDDDLIDMLLTLVAAGHETSANALSWLLFCLAEQPELQASLAEEALAAAGGGALAASHLAELPRIEAAVKEGLRLFPAVPAMGRQAASAQDLTAADGTALELPKGALVVISLYAQHRRRPDWEDADAFDIFRWIDRPDPPRGLYLPFGVGPRVCIGARFAMMEMILGLAALLRRVRFETCGATRCDPLHRVTLAPRAGMILRAAPR